MWITQKDQLIVTCDVGTLVFSDPQDFKYYSAHEVQTTDQ